ncbi:hypothetical protein LJR235_002384 [Pararhizobium sp. LjRoot235]|uniref:hypothetical protein n=1 Tax=Pararhizobium sp. LjRoot235 TaxID=3342291 RepID=UPI003ED08F80
MQENGLTWDDMRRFTVDGKGRLLWNGEVVKTESRLRLDWFQTTIAVLATLGTLLSGIYPFLVHFHVFGF